MKSGSKKIKRTKSILFILIIILLGIFSSTQLFKYIDIDKSNGKIDDNKTLEYYPVVEDISADIKKYYIYGRSFNIEGNLKETIDESTIKEVTLILKTKDDEISLKTNYEIKDDIISFKISNLINDGVILDNLKIGNYFLLLKVTLTDEKAKYYTLKNITTYGNLEYYSMTRDNQNKYITINFVSKNKISYVNIEVVDKKLPDDVYDIVIDPGHGGVDSGATYKGRHEETINLDVSKKVKTELEKIGFKVRLTRDGDYNPGHKDGSNQYGLGGRVSIPYESKAKYVISIHTNSDVGTIKKGGIEIYMANNSKLDLARLFINNILDNTAIETSVNSMFRKEKGIYVRTFSKDDMKSMKEEANKYNYEMYDVNTQTPYYYMIRETGGMVTNAYIDGRNPKYGKNDYYKSNIGVETYIIELGYINCDTDYNVITRDQVGYAKGIAKSFESYILQE